MASNPQGLSSFFFIGQHPKTCRNFKIGQKFCKTLPELMTWPQEANWATNYIFEGGAQYFMFTSTKYNRKPITQVDRN